MDIEIILESDMTPQHVAEFAVEAEKAGVRTAGRRCATRQDA
jgi:hypothetical protein